MTLHFLFEIDKLKKIALKLSAVVEENLADAVRAIEDGDHELATKVIDRDNEVDNLEIEIEEECLKTLALHQPVAKDLRLVVAVMKMNSDLERIGDLAVNIAERAKHLAGKSLPVDDFNVRVMADRVKTMLKKSLDAVCNLDAALAREVFDADDAVDDLARSVYGVARSAILARPDDECIDIQLNMLSVSRSLERVADHATNIAEDLVYLIEGKIVRHHTDLKMK